MTTVAQTIIGPDGRTVEGHVRIRPSSVFSSGSDYVGEKEITVWFTAGAFSVSLIPNDSGLPAGTSYTAVWQLSSGVAWAETWVVPTSAVPVTVDAVRVSTTPPPSYSVALAQLAQTSATLDQPLCWNGTTWAPCSNLALGLTPSGVAGHLFGFGVASQLSRNQNIAPYQAGVFAGITEYGGAHINLNSNTVSSSADSSIEFAIEGNSATGFVTLSEYGFSFGANVPVLIGGPDSPLSWQQLTLDTTKVYFQDPGTAGVTDTRVLKGAGQTAASTVFTVDANASILTVNGTTIPTNGNLPNWVAAPTTSTSPGTAGQVAYDANYLFICVASSVWIRFAKSAW